MWLSEKGGSASNGAALCNFRKQSMAPTDDFNLARFRKLTPEQLAKLPRATMEKAMGAATELLIRKERAKHEAPGGLIEFVKYFWDVLEPARPFVDGWVLRGMCQHLEAVTDGRIKRLLINVSPGSMKSLLVNTFWPAWEWGPKNKPNLRYTSFSYAAHLTERDNGRMRDLIKNVKFQRMYGDRFKLTKEGQELLQTDKTGWKFATSVLGVGTGVRGDRILLDDPHNVAEGESDKVRNSTVTWFEETMSNRLSDNDGAIVVIMQRVHDQDVSGIILDPERGHKYVHFCVPYDFDPERARPTVIGWNDPRTVAGEPAWPERFSETFLAPFRRNSFMWAGQYLQTPQVRGGNIFKTEWWKKYDLKGAKSIAPSKFDYIVGSLDTALTEKTQNDPSAMTVWGVFVDPKDRTTKAVLLAAWEKHLQLSGGEAAKQRQNELDHEWILRTKDKWGLSEWVQFTCRQFKVHRLLIESTAAGHPLAQELTRLARGQWANQLQPPKGDKEARAHSVTFLFTDELVYALGDYIEQDDGTKEWEFRKFATLAIAQCARFPKGRDDIVDTVAQCLRHLRDTNSLARRVEIQEAEDDERQYQRELEPLYPG